MWKITVEANNCDFSPLENSFIYFLFVHPTMNYSSEGILLFTVYIPWIAWIFTQSPRGLQDFLQNTLFFSIILRPSWGVTALSWGTMTKAMWLQCSFISPIVNIFSFIEFTLILFYNLGWVLVSASGGTWESRIMLNFLQRNDAILQEK